MSDLDSWTLEAEDARYPSALLDLEKPPKRLYGRGTPKILSTSCISIIGARRATPYGLACARMAGRVAAECGITVVSGGALGCDSAAARAALDAGGKTVVVSGCGADVIYPKSSADVYERALATGGAVISLEAWGHPPTKYGFPRRNKIIAALSESIIVCEAGQRSGTLSTALAAEELGRRLYALPGSIFSPESCGTNRLIADGASIVTLDQDLETLIALDYGRLRLAMEGAPYQCGRIMSWLFAAPTRPEELARCLGESVISVLGALSDYEAQGLVKRLPDGRYAPSEETYAERDRMRAQAQDAD